MDPHRVSEKRGVEADFKIWSLSQEEASCCQQDGEDGEEQVGMGRPVRFEKPVKDPRCTGFLLLCNKLPQTEQLGTTPSADSSIGHGPGALAGFAAQPVGKLKSGYPQD